MKFKINFIVLSTSLLFFSCNSPDLKTEDGTLERGIILSNMDETVNPKDDFYNYVNGNWMKNTEIPEDQVRWGGFGVLRKSTDKDVLEILDRASKSGKYPAGTDQSKAIAVFKSKLDTNSRNQLGIIPIKPALDLISNINSVADFQKVISIYATIVSQPFFGISAFSNPSNSSMNSAYLTPAGLGLPDKDFYLNKDSKSIEIREQYKAHISRMLQFLGDDKESASSQAETILNFETLLATPKLDKVQRRDFRKLNNPRSVKQIQEMVPAINWPLAFKDLGIEIDLDTLIVMQPKYMEAVQEIFENEDINTWKIVMRWATLNEAASQLTTEIEKANWDFYSKTLSGAKIQRPADERALATVNGTVGEALGKLYVDEMFPPEAKEKAEKMIANVIQAYINRIMNLEWMSLDTKEKAIEKLENFTVKIGYPDKWEDYSLMKVSSEKGYYENIVAVTNWSFKKNLSEINEPVDKTKWGMSPQTVNAYFNPFNNEIVFPAAILQPPFYDYKADDAVNYGGIGAVIGHEISHAFDDAGSRFDAYGNLVNWWTEEDLVKFTKRGKALSDQYSSIEVLDSVYVNGEFTLGENIGDLGGVLAGFDGLQLHFEQNGRPGSIDGFTPEQRFFMSWATVWRTKQRDEYLRNQVKTDPHTPGRWRATEPLKNVDAFYEAFNIVEGDSMYVAPSNRVRIW
ncbi:MAG: M13 family metallopeptidase [Flavobacteriales bacterium]